MEKSNFNDWLKGNMHKQKVLIPELVARTGISCAGIWNIVNFKNQSPRNETRAKLAQALNEFIPAEVEIQIERKAVAVFGLSWLDFTPSDLQVIPQAGGLYIIYDTTDRLVYVGMSKANIRARVKYPQTRFLFKQPLIMRGAFLRIHDPELCLKIETILIKFLGEHALLDVKGAISNFEN
ncbi:hypothetical protein [Methylobacterium sp. Leaf85]|uniref:hypothetical protein n=1 Tax=Methylobacterium sp. Leaf85 TaxID=1736241 RepID=UPI0009E6D588|nr:hypothetical protein [Methylobacterium sp. Leaf85]